MKEIILLVLLVVALLGILYIMPEVPAEENKIKKFSSYDELTTFLKTNTQTGYGYLSGEVFTSSSAAQKAVSESAVTTAERSEDYSTTNIQVAGVDEADIVKTDGKYIYSVSGNKIVILDAFPAENAKILSVLELSGTPSEIFINGDKLVVFGQTSYDYYSPKIWDTETGIAPPLYYYSPKTFVNVYDVSDRQNPVLKRNVSVDGSYFDSRMIGNYVYVITNQPVHYTEPIPLPIIYSGSSTKKIQASEIYYFDFPDTSYQFTNILAINTQNDAEESASKTFLLGATQSMYVSTDNIYIVYTKRLSEFDFYDRIIDKAIMPAVPPEIQIKINEVRNSDTNKYEKIQEIGKIFQNYLDNLNPEEAANIMKVVEEKMENIQREIAKEIEKTIIHKISVNNAKIEYKTNGAVPGYTLNQFSMDEYNGYFRIATTTGETWGSSSQNHLYVLDENLKIAGRLEDLAAGERIYSARFLGDKAYMVTFRQTDPLFVIDLSAPENPKVLGYLKIPGVSDYLHPYDKNHVIGVGRDATEEGRIQGMKLSLFDITDVANPKEISKYIIGERGTSSEALNDHKAFLFSKEKNLLVLPISLAEGGKWNAFNGAYVFNIDLTNGFALKGKVTHRNQTGSEEKEYYYDYDTQIRRSLYIDNVLYTLSQKMIKMNSLTDLNEVNKIEIS